MSSYVSKEREEVGRDHVIKPTFQGDSSSTWEESKLGVPKQLTEKLHESGKVNRSRGKKEEQVTPLSEKSPILHTTQAEPIEDMQWEKVTCQVQEPNFKFVLAPNPGLNDKEGSPYKFESGQGPIAMSFDPKLGWTEEKLGPKSGH